MSPRRGNYELACNYSNPATVPPPGVGGFQVRSLAITDDGKTIFVGSGPNDAVYVVRKLSCVYQISQTIAISAANLGDSIAVSPCGEWLFIGDSSATTNQGSVIVYQLQSGVYQQHSTLTASDPLNNAFFGDRLAIADTKTLVVGAGGFMGGDGKVYVFTRQNDDAWLETFTLPNEQPASLFGSSIAVSSGACKIIVGAPLFSGAVYEYRRTSMGYVLVQQLAVDVLIPPGSLFGSALAMSPSGCTLAAPLTTLDKVAVFVSTKHGFKQSAILDMVILPAANPRGVELVGDGKVLGISFSNNNVPFQVWYSCEGTHWTRRQAAEEGFIFNSFVTLSEDGKTLVSGGLGSQPLLIYTRK